MRPFRQFVLTRFNVGIYQPSENPALNLHLSPEAWMQHRMRLFVRYTLPSMAGQRCQNFTWLVFVDDATPEHWKEFLESIRHANLRIVYTTCLDLDFRRKELYAKVLQEVGQSNSTCITTRIDNDDAFHYEFIETIQKSYVQHADRVEPWAVLFSYGCAYEVDTNRFLLCRHTANNCPTLIEPVGNPQTVWCYIHGEIPKKFPTIYIEDKPYWMMVCHDQNIKNSMSSRNKFMKIYDEKPLPLKFMSLFNIQHPRG